MNKYLIIAITVVFTSIISCKNKKKDEQSLQIEQLQPPPSIIPEKEVEVIDTEPVDIDTVSYFVDEGVNIDDKYFVVVNSYTISEFAAERNKHWQKFGFNSKVIMKNDDGYYRLVLKSFDNHNDATIASLSLREENEEFSDAWVISRGYKIEEH